MTDIINFYKTKLQECGFKEIDQNGQFCPLGKLFQVPAEMGEGSYWVYGQKDLYDIKVHDFLLYEDMVFDIKQLNWPKALSITYYESVSGEELMPYRRLSPGCIKSFMGGGHPFRAVLHKQVPIRSIGIEIMPPYYEKYLKEAYPEEYIDPYEAFLGIDQTFNFPEMTSLLRRVWSFQGDGLSAKLFYEGKVAEAVALVMEYNRKRRPANPVKVTKKDREFLQKVVSYINEYYNGEISLEYLSHLACMGTTKLKSTFKQVYGCTISEYIQQRRLSHGEELLSTTDLTVEQISQAIGYSNAGRFAVVFRKSTGVLPGEYRKAYRNA